MSDMRYDKMYIKRAKAIVKESANIPYFSYRGRDENDDPIPLGKTWGFTISTNRDADILTESNWEVISRDMLKRFPKSVRVEPCSHWACGWVDHLNIRMIDSRGRVTLAGIAIIHWLDRLADYPVANEDDFSDREYEAYSESMLESIREIVEWGKGIDMVDNPPDDWKEKVIEAIRMSPDREVSHTYDYAWDREGYFRREDESIVIDVARSLGFVLPSEETESA